MQTHLTAIDEFKNDRTADILMAAIDQTFDQVVDVVLVQSARIPDLGKIITYWNIFIEKQKIERL